MPTLEELIRLVTAIQAEISDEYRAHEDDDEPGIQITIASDGETWAHQTGDNSYTGACYSYACWGVGAVYRDSEPADVARDLLEDLEEVMHEYAL